MPREIKFRAWDCVNEQILLVENIDFKNDLISLNEGDNSITDFSEMFTLMQYTGLKDSAGKEIYEGDIVEYEGMKGNVFFNEESLQFVFETNLGGYEFKNGQRYDEYPEYGTYKIIGNIYEHPELLES